MAQAPPELIFERTAANHLAWINTLLSLQRTLMAAQRTAVTLIAFGFTVAQFFQNLAGRIPEELLALGHALPRNVGLVMIVAGVASLALFVWEYQAAVRYLGSGSFADLAVRGQAPLHRLTCNTAYLIIIVGLLAFASVFVSF
jgi:putative membrane protein